MIYVIGNKEKTKFLCYNYMAQRYDIALSVEHAEFMYPKDFAQHVLNSNKYTKFFVDEKLTELFPVEVKIVKE